MLQATPSVKYNHQSFDPKSSTVNQPLRGTAVTNEPSPASAQFTPYTTWSEIVGESTGGWKGLRLLCEYLPVPTRWIAL